MYAIAFDRELPSDARDALYEHGFCSQQGSIYFGSVIGTSVTCVLAIQDLAKRFTWLQATARDVRMLRIEENNDLRPAFDAAT